MRALLDVNVLIALFDADHISHHAAVGWFSANAVNGWASCPITQNGCVRIMSHPGYPGAHAVVDIVAKLRRASLESVHEFWADDVSVLDDQLIDTTRIHGPRQLTDVYLLALAVRHGGALVTFDRSIAVDAVRGASAASLVVL
ncbi:TA system VapC family ribonuclease toxin [Gemmatimonas sp.]|uniref:TA system VapC family ribonuclease toxin n=1 Tax=Gemmatimonas sp. TaxID=1962908 RepID=UPI00286E630C|nr:TA system VapC family ribonuclease toxin [Gemmatimonas sp.]